MPQVMSSVFLCLQVFGASITDASLSHDMLIVMYALGYAKCFLVLTGVWGQYNRCHPISRYAHSFVCLGFDKCFLVFTGV